MDLRFNKQGFAFTFLTLFVSFLMFAFASFLLAPNNFDQEEAFTQARISQLSSEISYFEESYLPTATSYSLFNVIDSLLNYSRNSSVYATINNNYSKLNDLIYEGITNETFDSSIQNNLVNKSLKHLLSSYDTQIEDNLNVNFTYDITEIIVYEKDPFFITVQVLLNFQVVAIDNISSWDIAEVYEVNIPIYSFEDPEFVIYEDQSILIRPIAQFASNIDWDLDLLNETINETYAVVYVEPDHDYTIGSSFLKRFLNVSDGSFKDVLLRYSFDIDEEEGPVYDYILQNEKAMLYGDTLTNINFDNESTQGGDITVYNNSAIVFGATWQETGCVFGGCYDLDGIDDYLVIPHNESLEFENKSFSINIWFNSQSNFKEILNKTESGVLDLELSWGLNRTIELFIDDNNNSPIIEETQNQFNLNSWNMITLVINPGNISYLYVNGKKQDLAGAILDAEEIDTTLFTNFTNFADIGIGGSGAVAFDGLVDEINIYRRGLSEIEVAKIYSNAISTLIEYEDSVYRRGVFFDGEDDFIQTGSNIISSAQDNFSFEIWFKAFSSSSNETIFEMDLDGNSSDPAFLSLERDFEDISFKLYDQFEVEILNADVADVSAGVWNHIVVSVNNSAIDLYLNGFLRDRVSLSDNVILGSNMTISRKINSSEKYFNGIIDEFVIYNKTFSQDDVRNHFYNYRSTVKGCCNYVTLIDPNSLGYNTANFTDNVSYSSKLFYDNYKRGIKSNVTIYNVTNLTSTSTSNDYFNFMLDLCLMDAYNVFSYNDTAQPARLVQAGDYGSTCSGLVEAGIY